MTDVAEGFDPVAQSVGAARRAALRLLRASAPDLEDVLADDIRTIVSELATNAVLHARTPFRISVAVAADRVRVAVHDGSAGRPRPSRLRDERASTGRGLHMVADLSDEWGVEPDPDGAGKTVWCDLSTARPAGGPVDGTDDLDALLARYDEDA